MKTLKWVNQTTWHHLPDQVRSQAHRCLLDTLGAAIAGRQTRLSDIIHNFAGSAYGGRGAHLWQNGREVSPPGAALANGTTIDALDIHDGHTLVKGHAGAAVVPAALAGLSLSPTPVSGRELLTTLVVGYEVALRAGLSLHATACDYHTSGAWNALGCAAITARYLGLTPTQTRHALGIAEYHGPRSQMMRCIDHPTMLKDGSGWGGMAGVSAALLARNNFTGAPALTVEADDVGGYWQDLGQTWLILEQYFKPQAVCRWAQPAIRGVLALQQAHTLLPQTITKIRVNTFHEATRLACRHPASTEQAQYSLPFPVAAALVHGRLGPAELSGAALGDPAVLQLSNQVELVEEPGFSARFPAQRIARVQIETNTGQTFNSGEVQANWEAGAPPTNQELKEKFRWLAGTCLPKTRATELEEAVWHCAELPNAGQLAALLAAPV